MRYIRPRLNALRSVLQCKTHGEVDGCDEHCEHYHVDMRPDMVRVVAAEPDRSSSPPTRAEGVMCCSTGCSKRYGLKCCGYNDGPRSHGNHSQHCAWTGCVQYWCSHCSYPRSSLLIHVPVPVPSAPPVPPLRVRRRRQIQMHMTTTTTTTTATATATTTILAMKMMTVWILKTRQRPVKCTTVHLLPQCPLTAAPTLFWLFTC